jgi:hypothetical protein
MNENMNSHEGASVGENLSDEAIRDQIMKAVEQITNCEDYERAHSQYLIHASKFDPSQQITLEKQFQGKLLLAIRLLINDNAVLAKEKLAKYKELFSDEEVSGLEGDIALSLGEFSNT